MKIKLLQLLVFLTFIYSSSHAQENTKATFSKVATSMKIVPSISSRSSLKLAPKKIGEAKDKKSGKNVSVYGKGLPLGNDALIESSNKSEKKQGRAPTLVFDGANSDSQPSDPDGAVGQNHYVLVYNTGFRIFDKLGNPLTDQLDTSVIFPEQGCCDLTVSYDTQAERFVMTFLGGGVQVAVSQTSNPITGGWYVYNFPMNTDYQKLSIWSDGYYFTANKDSGSAGTSEVVFAIDRTKMLVGNPTAAIVGFPLPGIETSGFYSPQAFNVTSSNYPAAGNVPIIYMQDDAWTGVTVDHLKLWTIDMDWLTTTNSTISSPQNIITTPFTSVFDGGSFVNLPQPNGGATIDALQATIMNQAQFRKFANHNSAIFNFVVDVDGSSTKLAGIRWFELRQNGDGQPWSIYQEGTYTSPRGKHAWNAGMGIDVQGNIGMGYTGMGGLDNTFVSSFYTGRFANDPLNTMSITENIIASGNQNIPSFRYGDYSKVALDPTDDKSFWFVNEYMNSGRKDVIGVFKIAPNFANDIGVVAIVNPNTGTLTSSGAITVSIFNYGQNPVSNFPVSFQIGSGSVITETFTGTIASAGTAQYTFTATTNLSSVGQTYIIKGFTTLVGDQDNANNATIKNVTHLFPNDIGVNAIVSPVSGSNLTASETINVKVKNFGGQPQSNFPISYSLNGTVVNEVYNTTLAPNTEASFSFAQTGNFGTIGQVYNLSAQTGLSNDSNATNNATSSVVLKFNCQPIQNCNDGDNLVLVQLNTLNNVSTCGLNGYNDFTSLSTDLEQGSTNLLTLKTQYGSQHVSLWIDFNDDFVFSDSEKLILDFIIGANQGNGNYTGTTNLVIPTNATLGQHLMRIKTNYNDVVSNNACANSQYGETEDYTVNITGSNLSVKEISKEKTDLIIGSQNNRIFEIALNNSEFDSTLVLSVHNILGQKVVYDKVKNNNGSYSYLLDMSYAPTGVYLVRLGNNQSGKVKRIIVK
jgi:GEVED domain/Secretion system C-terminal sorting domain